MSEVLLGPTPKYYEYRGAEPYLNFDGVDDRAIVPYTHSNDLDITFCADKIVAAALQTIVGIYSIGNNKRSWRIAIGSDGSLSIPMCPDGVTVTKTITVSNGSWSSGDTIRFLKVGANATVFVNNVSVASITDAPSLFDAGIPLTVGTSYNNSSTNTYANYFKGGIYCLSINGYSYINQGDQNPNNILPSTPAGADGTVSGAGWRYVGIDGHYETVTALNSWLSTTTLTEPLEVILLEPMDTSAIPTSKDGWPIDISVGYPGIGVFGYNTMNLSLSLGLQ